MQELLIRDLEGNTRTITEHINSQINKALAPKLKELDILAQELRDQCKSVKGCHCTQGPELVQGV